MTSITTYTEIPPTYLCIKQHSVTKKKYFCKTSRLDPIKYLGSGTYWKRHIKKHGKHFVETLWISDLYYDTSIKEIALHFSCENNIVESDDWANLIPENGLDGGSVHHSDETRAKISASHIGMKPSEETRSKLSASRTGKKASVETKEKLSILGTGRKPSDETRSKISAAKIGKKQSEEHKAKTSAARTGKKHSDETKTIMASKMASKFFSLISTRISFNKSILSRYYPEFKQFY